MRKNNLISILFIFLNSFIYCQTIDVGLGPTFQVTQSNYLDFFAQHEKRLNKGAFNYQIGIGATFKKFNFSVAYSPVIQITPLIVRGAPFFQLREGFEIVEQKFNVHSVPITIGYRIEKGRKIFGVHAGISVMAISENNKFKDTGELSTTAFNNDYQLKYSMRLSNYPFTPMHSLLVSGTFDYRLRGNFYLATKAGFSIGQTNLIGSTVSYVIYINGVDTFASSGLALSKGDYFFFNLGVKYGIVLKKNKKKVKT